MSTQILELLPAARTVRFEGKYQIIKAEKRRLIGGYANIEVRDSQGETITVEAWKEALPKFMAAEKYRNVHIRHSNIEVGKVIPSVTDSQNYEWTTHVDDLGIFVVCEIDRPIKEADRVWEAIERGEIHDFSIAGEAIHRTGEHGEIIDQLELHEITLCPRGSNHGGKFVIIKAVPSTEIPEWIAKELMKTLSSNAIFTRGDGKRFIIHHNQARKGEIGPSEAVSVLEQRTSETGKETKLSNIGNQNAGTTPTNVGDPTNPAQNGATKLDMQKLLAVQEFFDKFDMQKFLELEANLTKVKGLLEEFKTSLQTEQKTEKPSIQATTIPVSPQPTATAPTPTAPTISNVSVEEVKKAVLDEIVKMVTPQKRTVVPDVGTPGQGLTAFEVNDEQLLKESWPETEARLKAARAATGRMFQ